MAYFLSSFLQKRVLRYALSRLQLVDTDALDLDSLGITWGQRSTFELKDVGLRLEKLSSIFQLPPACDLKRARVSLLRVTIPADIYSSSIIVEAEGIEVRLKVLPDDKSPNSKHTPKHGKQGSQTDAPPSGEEQPNTILPTTTDLAQSFLESEPRKETEELQAALAARSQHSPSSDWSSDDEDEELGLNEGVSLPSFVAGFLQGILDRLQLKISDVTLRVDMEVQPDMSSSKQSAVERVDPISGVLTIRDVSVDAVATETAEDMRLKVGKRLATLSEVHMLLVSDPSVFESHSRFNQPSSPSVSHPKSSPVQSRGRMSPHPPQPDSSDSGSFHTMTQSTIFLPHQPHHEHSEHLEASTHSGMFSDAATEDEYGAQNDPYNSRSLADSRDDDMFFDNPAYLEEALQYADDLEDSTGDLYPSYSSLPRYPATESFHTGGHQSTGQSEGEPASHSMAGSTHSLGPSSSQMLPSFPAGDPESTQQDTGVEQPPEGLYVSGTYAPDNRSTQEGDTEDHGSDKLSESKIFTHEEAQSMYMSAMSNAPSDTSSLPRMPGAWSSPKSDSTLMDRAAPVGESQTELPGPRETAASTPRASTVIATGHSGDSEDVGQTVSGIEGGDEPLPPDHLSGIAKRVLDVEKVTLWIPSLSDKSNEETVASVVGQPAQPMKESTFSTADSVAMDFPERSKPRVPHANQLHDSIATSPPLDRQGPGTSRRAEDHFEGLTEDDKTEALELDITSMNFKIDIACGWLLAKMGQNFVSVWSTTAQGHDVQKAQSSPLNFPPLSLSLTTCRVRFLERVYGQLYGHSDIYSSHHGANVEDVLLQVTLSDIAFHSILSGDTVRSRLNISKFVLGHSSEDIITFDESIRLRESVRDVSAPTHGDISISFTKSPQSTQIHLSTLPLHLSLNLHRIDETLGWFGGLSTVLELGNSIASTSTSKESKPGPKPKPRGVHFERTPVPETTRPQANALPWKLNCRIGGLGVDLAGKKCSLKLETSAVKIVSRFAGMGIQIDEGRLSGPHTSGTDPDSIPNATLRNIRLEYLSEPKEVDLDRLLNLLTPSKDKYHEDDDIMLDTLFRQRRQGAVLRITVSNLTGFVPSPVLLQPLSTLGDELAKLSTMAKYIPQDDRPGIMTLALVKEVDVRVHIGKDVGTLSLISQGVEGCHVSFPSLVAGRVSTITVVRNGNEELVSEAISQETPAVSARGPLPMIMARYIAGEMEPTVKLKLFNLRVEYTVPAFTALLGLSNEMTAEDIAANMAHSVVNLTDLKAHGGDPLEDSSVASGDGARESPTRLTVSLRDCLLGLNPRQSPAKGLVVFADARFSGTLREDEPSDATIDVRKASLVIIDNVANVGAVDNFRHRTSASSHSGQVRTLEGMGYVPVCSVSSAQAIVKVMQLDKGGDKSLDVELKDDLLIIETCADSTQTLITILNGLAPPSPPDKTLKYRTEVIPIEDMLNSFTGNAFETEQPSGLDGSAPEAGGLSPIDEDTADELEYVSDFSPVKGTSGGSEGLTDSFHSDTQVASGILGLDIQDDHFGKKSAVGGTAHRWDSTHNTYSLANEVKLHGSPLRIRVRDVHVIWNLFDGYDWQKTRDTISKTVKDVQAQATEKRSRPPPAEEEEEDSVIGDFLFNSVYIGIPTNRDPRDLSREINRNIDDLTSETGSYATSTTVTGFTGQHPPGSKKERLRLARSKHHKMTFELKGIAADMVVFPPGSGETQSSLDVRVDDLEIFDHLPTSTWKKFATYMQDVGEREIGTSMLHLEVLSVKPIAELAASELIVKATILPLRLHVDQDALDFMSRFFEFKDDSAPVHPSPDEIPFIQRAEVNAVRVRLDFKPKRVDYGGLRSGRTTEFMNFFVLDQADMVLRHVIIYGVSGFDRLGQTLNDIWMPDIKANQLPGVLAGLAPVRSLVNIGSGVKDLVVIPMREYKKDGRVVRSIHKGAVSFAKTTTNELLKLGAKLAIGTQTALQNAEGLLNQPGAAVPAQRVPATPEGRLEDTSIDEDEQKQISLYADQPVGVVQGLRGAYSRLERDLLLARDAIVAVPGEVVEGGSAAGAAKALWKRAPTVVLRPAIGASKAVGQTLLGAGNTLDPQNRRRADDKYKRH